jgi:hypothetical protein
MPLLREISVLRCYFIQNDRVSAVESLTASSNEEAIREAQRLFRKQQWRFSGFEIWERSRFIHRYLEGSCPNREEPPST